MSKCDNCGNEPWIATEVDDLAKPVERFIPTQHLFVEKGICDVLIGEKIIGFSRVRKI